jgi:hypothetical protein
MSRASVLAAGRKFAEAGMTDTCTIGVWKQSGELNETTGEYEYALDPIVYSGMCEFEAQNVQANDVDAASQLLVRQASTLKLPMGSSLGIEKGMTVVMTASGTDPDLPGTRATIQAPFASSYATARRFAVTVVS